MKIYFSLHQIQQALVNECMRMGYQFAGPQNIRVTINHHADAPIEDKYNASVEFKSLNDPKPVENDVVVFDANKKGDA